MCAPGPSNRRIPQHSCSHRLSPACTADSFMVGENELINWNSTFKMFDRDGGGDISLQEIGLLFRQLGYAPAEAEMRALVALGDTEGVDLPLTSAALAIAANGDRPRLVFDGLMRRAARPE